MNLVSTLIPHRTQRYDTPGDWSWIGHELDVRVSELGDWKMEALVAIHEIVEAVLCRSDGISGAVVDAFDMAFEGDEPGAAPACPYFQQHATADKIERLVAAELGVNWMDYTKAVDSLPPAPEAEHGDAA